ncbi:hypothetical protein OAB20_02485 [Winogradskyella sp.]|nr:hypothetical protein [Winogradskyella sp.]
MKYLKLGFSTFIDEIRPEADDDIFITDVNQIIVQDLGLNLRKSYLNNIYVALPIHLELDFFKPQFNKKVQDKPIYILKGGLDYLLLVLQHLE